MRRFSPDRSRPYPPWPLLSCVLHLELAADGLHSRVAAVHVFRVEARVAQLDGGLAADMEAVGAVDDHGLGLVQLANPLRELLGIPPPSTLGDILPARDGRPRPNVDHLNRLAGGQHLVHFLRANAWDVAELWLLERPRPGNLGRVRVAQLE